ncbi:response regulator transcription factor [Caproiciproducens sp. AGMB10547]|uniref:Stage 0 sporulation protein A homolog n=1 Tax=Caproiciproducens faecalis TaxID=2820301 RepID=A0ABS7DRC4_9FIRM|nr:response regulator transcription factor [Caproiciproducens faecalis]MBW7573850.1 response regulator transcription factor [Caproiciproducens faecalis]
MKGAKTVNSNELFLIVEDDRQIRSFISFSLKTREYRSIEATTGKGAMKAIVSEHPDIMILDLGLPDMDGLEIIRQVRAFSDMPIIVVSARDQDKEKIEALDAGADDYLTKPFSINELLARLRVILRHLCKGENPVQENYHIGELEVNLEKHTVTLSGNEVHFTPMEFNVLALLVRNSGKVLTHSYILKEVWGSYLDSDMQSLRVFMANIRRKLEKNPAKPRYIITEVGIGYRFADE